MEEPFLHHPHDHFFKETFSRPENAVAFFQTFLPRDIRGPIQWSTLKREQGSFLDETLRERASDLLFTVKWDQRKTALLHFLFEHQSEPDPLMSFRLLRYQVRILEGWLKQNPLKRLPLIVSMVLYQGGRPWNASTRYVDLIDVPDNIGDGWQRLVPNFEYELIQLRKEETLEVIENLSLRVVLKLMRELGRSPSAQDIEEAFRAILDLSIHVTDMAYIRSCLTYLFQAAPGLDEETFYRHIHLLNSNPALKDEAMNIASALIRDSEARGEKIGEARGEARGEKIGEARGERMGQARLLRRLLTARFGELPAWANEAIDRADLDDLDRWGQFILTAQNLDDVLLDN